SWLIVLFGAEISFAHQNVDMFEFEPDCLNASNNFKKLLSLRITQLIVKNFTLGLKPFEVKQISQTLEIPTRLLRQILFELVESRILNETKTEDYKEVGYQPAIDIDLMSIQYVINALENRGTKDIPVVQTKELDVLSQSLNSFFDLSNSSEANKLLKDM
ncbi:MAG: YihY/virulence factor BrkB family protein, partial [Candidatus Omnitrophica bacterium]|nr:YihY/virulence factor BrkB family protein [Candidatus Omnitrophota bacterium]